MSKFESVKNHLRNNKVTYIACGVTAVVVAGTTYYFTRNGSAVKAVAAATTEFVGDTVVNNAPTMNNTICWKPTMKNIVELADASTPSKQIGILDENGNIIAAFRSITQAARQTGHSATMISRNINHAIDHVKGDKFVLLEELVDATKAAA